MIVLLLVLIINIVWIVKPNNKKEVILDDVKLKEEISKNDSIAIMLEQSDGTYKESNESTFPINMMFNNEKSGCIDKEGQRIENSLTYSNGVVYVETNSTTYCYVYFDKMDIVSISVTTPPNKIKYDLGDTFDPTGMVVTAYYGDGTSKVITNYTYNIDGELSTENNSITISYTENGVTKTTTYVVQVSFPCTVKIRSMAITGTDAFEQTYVTIAGQTYKGNTFSSNSTDLRDITTVVVSSGTIMSCYMNGLYLAMPPTVSVNGSSVATDSDRDGYLQYDYNINGDVTVDLYTVPGMGASGMVYGSFIRILEDSQPSYNITLVPGDDTGGAGSGSVSLEQYTAKPGEIVKIRISGSCSTYKGGTISYVLNGETVSYTYGEGTVVGANNGYNTYESFTMPAADVTITYNGFTWNAGSC